MATIKIKKSLISINWLLLIPLGFIMSLIAIPMLGWTIINAPVWYILVLLIVPVVGIIDIFLMVRYSIRKKLRARKLIIPAFVVTILCIIVGYTSYWTFNAVKTHAIQQQEAVRSEEVNEKTDMYFGKKGISLEGGLILAKKCQVQQINYTSWWIEYALRGSKAQHTSLQGEDWMNLDKYINDLKRAAHIGGCETPTIRDLETPIPGSI